MPNAYWKSIKVRGQVARQRVASVSSLCNSTLDQLSAVHHEYCSNETLLCERRSYSVRLHLQLDNGIFGRCQRLLCTP